MIPKEIHLDGILLWRRSIRFLFPWLLIMLSTGNFIKAQNSAIEFWPETDLWYRLSPSFRFSAFIPVTKYHESQTRDLNVYLQADYSWGHTKKYLYVRLIDEKRRQIMKTWMVRPGYMAGWSLDDPEQGYTEDMLFAEIHKRMPIVGNILHSHRIRTDFRWTGHDPEYSYRIRYRVMLEKEFVSGKTSIVPYFNVEPFYDSRYKKFNRIRVVAGSTFARAGWFALEGNITYQYDSKYYAENLYALNLILHFYLHN
jgi:hypothetical protein